MGQPVQETRIQSLGRKDPWVGNGNPLSSPAWKNFKDRRPTTALGLQKSNMTVQLTLSLLSSNVTPTSVMLNVDYL